MLLLQLVLVVISVSAEAAAADAAEPSLAWPRWCSSAWQQQQHEQQQQQQQQQQWITCLRVVIGSCSTSTRNAVTCTDTAVENLDLNAQVVMRCALDMYKVQGTRQLPPVPVLQEQQHNMLLLILTVPTIWAVALLLWRCALCQDQC
jgi:hypothetical protein